MTTVVSIDWGGTNLKAVCLRPEKKTLFYQAPASNIRLVRQADLRGIIHNLVTELQLASYSPDYLLIGAAGAGDKTAGQNLKAEINKQIPSLKVCKIYPDYKCNHAAALGGKSGILSINGTGSLLYYSNYSSEKRLGGWGYLFDSAPSGACFGRMVLRSALEYCEGTAAKKNIFNKLKQNYAFQDSATILSDIYQADNQQKHLGNFADVLTSCFDEEDSEAKKLINTSIEQLKARVSFMLESIPESFPTMSGTGGLWDNWPEFAHLINEMVKNNFPRIKLRKPRYKYVYGPLIYQSKACKECNRIFSLIAEKDKKNE
ncbi:MAG: BadF/BadG/BcrA/BcrD ATPase family protein [Candidatus Rifleibacteriota bacterium]